MSSSTTCMLCQESEKINTHKMFDISHCKINHIIHYEKSCSNKICDICMFGEMIFNNREILEKFLLSTDLFEISVASLINNLDCLICRTKKCMSPTIGIKKQDLPLKKDLILYVYNRIYEDWKIKHVDKKTLDDLIIRVDLINTEYDNIKNKFQHLNRQHELKKKQINQYINKSIFKKKAKLQRNLSKMDKYKSDIDQLYNDKKTLTAETPSQINTTLIINPFENHIVDLLSDAESDNDTEPDE